MTSSVKAQLKPVEFDNDNDNEKMVAVPKSVAKMFVGHV